MNSESNNEFKNAVEAGGGSGNSWKPENAGDTIIGTYIGKKENVGLNNSNVYLTKEDNNEDATSVWGSSVLDNKFEEIPLNSRVKIEFLGRVKGKSPQPYKDFKVLYITPTVDPFKD